MSRSGGTPAESATCSSPPDATSRCMPSSWARRAMARQRKALRGVGDAVAPRRDRLTAGMAQVILVVDEERCAELLHQLEQVDAADVEMPLLVDRCRAWKEMPLQRCGRDVVVGRHGDAGYGSIRPSRGGGEGPRCLTSTIVPCFVTPAPVAQRIEHRPPEPVAQVRVLPGALEISGLFGFQRGVPGDRGHPELGVTSVAQSEAFWGLGADLAACSDADVINPSCYRHSRPDLRLSPCLRIDPTRLCLFDLGLSSRWWGGRSPIRSGDVPQRRGLGRRTP